MNVSVTPSMLAAAGRCMMQIPYFHLMRLILPPGLARELGKGLHKQILEVDRRHFIATGTYKPLAELKEGFVSDLQRVLPEITEQDDVVQLYGGITDAYGVTEDNGLEMLDEYNKDRSVTTATKVEDSFEVSCADTTMRGRFDMVISDAHTKDLKTKDLSKKSSRMPDPEKVAHDVQLASYAFAQSRLTEQMNQSVDMLLMATTKTKPVIKNIELPVFTEESHNAVEEKAYRLGKIITADAFYPVDKSSQNGWVCQEKYCGAWRAYDRRDSFEGCPFGQRAQVSVAVGGR